MKEDSFNANDGWCDGEGNPYCQNEIDDAEIALMHRFSIFRPIDMAMFGVWEKEKADLAFLGGAP